MSKEFYISADRRVVVKNQEDDYIIVIEEIGSELKTVKFPAKRWAQFVASRSNITSIRVLTNYWAK